MLKPDLPELIRFVMNNVRIFMKNCSGEINANTLPKNNLP